MKKNKILENILVILVVFFLIGTILPSGMASIGHHEPYTKKLLENADGKFSEKMKQSFNFRDNIKNIYRGYGKNLKQSGIFTSVIHTTCNDVEKTKEVYFGFFNDIDVDDNENTGINGADIRVQFLILPYILPDPNLIFGLLFTVNIERIGEEIKDKNFKFTMDFGNNNLEMGYWSPSNEGNEIPNSIRISCMLFFNPTEQTNGLKFYVNPEYLTGREGKQIVFYAKHTSEDTEKIFSFDFEPAIETQMTISSTRNQGEWKYQFIRESSTDAKITVNFTRIKDEEEKETVFTIDEIPKELSFSLALTPLIDGGGSFLYESDEMYDVEVLVTSTEMGVCKYATIKNTPRKINAEWTPTRENGSYSIVVDSDGTDFILKDSLTNPTVNLTIRNLEDIDMTAQWNLTNPGEFVVKKNPSFNIDIEFYIGEWVAKLNAMPAAEDISISWYTNITGYLEYDTNWQPLNEIDLLIQGEDLGIRTVSEMFKAEDFRLDWTVWPPVDWNLETTGEIEFTSISIELYLQGSWHHLWPW